MPDYYIWTENKSLEIDGVDVSCTILKYQTEANKKIAGIDISFVLASGSNPIFDISDQLTETGWEHAGEVHAPGNDDLRWTKRQAANGELHAIKQSEFKIVMAGAINEALDSQGQHGTLANFKNTTFTIADVQIADGSANLVSASDISLAEPLSQGVFTATRILQNDWNMFGSSFDGSFTDNSNVQISGSYSTYKNGGFQNIDNTDVSSNFGYFIRCSGPGEFQFNFNNDINALSGTSRIITLDRDWNMFGTTADATFVDLSNEVIPGSFSTYFSGGFQTPEGQDLSANFGYFIRLNNPGNIQINYT